MNQEAPDKDETEKSGVRHSVQRGVQCPESADEKGRSEESDKQ